jgi:hypothetical protein
MEASFLFLGTGAHVWRLRSLFLRTGYDTHKALWDEYFFCGTSSLQRKEGEVFILTPQKLDVGNKSVKIGTSVI